MTAEVDGDQDNLKVDTTKLHEIRAGEAALKSHD